MRYTLRLTATLTVREQRLPLHRKEAQCSAGGPTLRQPPAFAAPRRTAHHQQPHAPQPSLLSSQVDTRGGAKRNRGTAASAGLDAYMRAARESIIWGELNPLHGGKMVYVEGLVTDTALISGAFWESVKVWAESRILQWEMVVYYEGLIHVRVEP